MIIDNPFTMRVVIVYDEREDVAFIILLKYSTHYPILFFMIKLTRVLFSFYFNLSEAGGELHSISD